MDIYLKAGREKSVLQRHPWVFSGAIARVVGGDHQNSPVKVYDSQGRFLAYGSYSHHSSIRVRLWSWEERKQLDENLVLERLQQAIELRKCLPSLRNTSAYRVVHGESDGMPGVIVDRYNDVFVLQILHAGSLPYKDILVQAIVNQAECKAVYERSDEEIGKLEGLPARDGWLWGARTSTEIEITEAEHRYLVNIGKGHKTGFYLDQRENRQILQQYAQNKRALNCFSYTGSFSICALAGGATQVISVDASADALETGRANMALNGMDPARAEWIGADVFNYLREQRDRAERYDLIILDPPKFAPTRAQVQRAARGYKDINLLAFKLLNPGGTLFTFSCSGGVSSELFQKIVADAALDADRRAKIIGRMHQAPDHPIGLNFPEGEYLKGLICRVV